jgi:hypothetical protein
MLVPSPPQPRLSVTESSLRSRPHQRGASWPKSRPSPSNAGSVEFWLTGHPAHRATNSVCSNFPAAPGVPTPSGESRLAFVRRSNEIRGSPRLDPRLIPHLKVSVSSQIDREESSTSQGVRRHASLASNGTSSWTVTPFGVLEATAMWPSS